MLQEQQLLKAKMAFVDELIKTMKEQNKLIEELVGRIQELITTIIEK